MQPYIGKIAFTLAILNIFLALIPLPILNRNSPEFIVDLLALSFSFIFLIIVVWDIRKQVKRTLP